MGKGIKNLLVVIFLLTCGVLVSLVTTDTSLVADSERSSTDRGNVGSLLANYKVWKAA